MDILMVRTERPATKHIAIVGAGIGGLSTAIFLKRAGYEVTVYERASSIAPVGAGILLACNALQVFSKLGLSDKIIEAGHRISRIHITDAQFRPLTISDLVPLEKKFGVPHVSIHRAALLDILVAALGAENIKLDKSLRQISLAAHDQAHVLHFEDGSQRDADFVIGADGIHSVVRAHLFGNVPLRSADQISWRGVCEFDLPDQMKEFTYEAWGHGLRFGFSQIDPRRLYWFAVIRKEDFIPGKSCLDYFGDFHPLAQQMIQATSPSALLSHELWDLQPLADWHKAGICLVGDAAHASTPNMGQGACQAIEDAFTIGHLASTGLPLDEVFSRFQKIRKTRALFIVRNSRLLGHVAQWKHPLAVRFRNSLAKTTPPIFLTKSFEYLFDLRYIAK